jgi:type IV pilus assembly protein PilX
MSRQRVGSSGVQGASLIIVLIMLVVIGLTSAASLRNASSNERVSNNFRMHLLAEQYAEAALRYCEAQLTSADGLRVASLREAALLAFTGPAAPGWVNPLTWTGAGGAFASLTSVPGGFVKSSVSAFVPLLLPQCAVERQALPLLQNGVSVGSTDVYVVTARGFSPDYRESRPGLSTSGSVVWLQSWLSIRRATPADAGTLADRLWLRIINPPFS